MVPTTAEETRDFIPPLTGIPPKIKAIIIDIWKLAPVDLVTVPTRFTELTQAKTMASPRKE